MHKRPLFQIRSIKTRRETSRKESCAPLATRIQKVGPKIGLSSPKFGVTWPPPGPIFSKISGSTHPRPRSFREKRPRTLATLVRARALPPDGAARPAVRASRGHARRSPPGAAGHARPQATARRDWRRELSQLVGRHDRRRHLRAPDRAASLCVLDHLLRRLRARGQVRPVVRVLRPEARFAPGRPKNRDQQRGPPRARRSARGARGARGTQRSTHRSSRSASAGSS